MNRSRVGIALPIAVIGVLATLVSAQAADPITSEDLKILFSGSRLDSSEIPAYSDRTDVWRFAENGGVTAEYSRWEFFFDGYSENYYSDHGQWSIEGPTLCLQFRETFEGVRRCFSIAKTTGNAYGAHMYVATDVADGSSWKFALSR